MLILKDGSYCSPILIGLRTMCGGLAVGLNKLGIMCKPRGCL